jgi:phosphoglycerol transferase MdoB-like AlkP superfamily enzyme
MTFSHFMHRYGTPLTAGLFAVSTISGVALFFHWAPRTFHAMHEWLSLLLLAPFVLHLWKNWKPLLAYAKRKTLLIPLVLSIVVAVPFALTAGKGRGGNPAFQTAALMTEASVADLAPVFQATPEALLQHLRKRGYKATSAGDSVATIAKASAVPATEVLYAMMPARRTNHAAE